MIFYQYYTYRLSKSHNNIIKPLLFVSNTINNHFIKRCGQINGYKRHHHHHRHHHRHHHHHHHYHYHYHYHHHHHHQSSIINHQSSIINHHQLFSSFSKVIIKTLLFEKPTLFDPRSNVQTLID